ncbi:hypothetical protein E2C01_091904 [Portunus trituberculatus]|uniref:Uncharacterized protein n=1 Tax=Portunus trituberculatus TaxID=210409 RepID=A0A5B7JWE5_PORTR|nr:hypothetical protein [Portunus trituberculatus]
MEGIQLTYNNIRRYGQRVCAPNDNTSSYSATTITTSSQPLTRRQLWEDTMHTISKDMIKEGQSRV